MPDVVDANQKKEKRKSKWINKGDSKPLKMNYGNVNIYKTKSKKSQKLGRVSNGTTVKILDMESRGWPVQIKHGEITGWIYADSSWRLKTQEEKKEREQPKQPTSSAGTDKKKPTTLRYSNDKESAIETMEISVYKFLYENYASKGYTMLFNFMAGNPFYQSKYMSREAPVKATGSLNEWGGIDKIPASRLQTKIKSYNESNLGDRGYIHLPLNTSLKYTHSMEYAPKALSLTEGLTTSIIRGDGGFGRSIDEFKKKIALTYDTRSGQLLQGAFNKLTGSNVNVFSTAGIMSKDISSGISVNPRTYEQYSSSAIREFEFTWKFYPRNEGESTLVNNVIKKFRYHSLAKRGKSHPLRMANPDRVLLRLYWFDMNQDDLNTVKKKNESFEYLFKFKPLVITKVDIAYGGDIPTYFKGTNAPTEVTLTVGMKEQEHVYADDVAIGY